MKRLTLLIMLCFLSVTFFSFNAHSYSYTQNVEDAVIKGKITDETGSAVPGANVILEGTQVGTISTIDGTFELTTKKTGAAVVVVSFMGYEEQRFDVELSGSIDLGQISLMANIVGLKEVEIIASIAVDRQTPVAASTLRGSYIEQYVGNQEFPEILKFTPSVYATKQGGGFGDARINVRGFDQRNTAVMINGVPVNDMENGWVYWSNWAGLSDVTSSMQVQRGLGASKLAISSVGGTINIITNAAKMRKGTSAGIGIGNDGYQKYSLMHSTGLMDNGWAVTLQGTRTAGNGYVDGTKFSAWSYFASISKNIGDKHQIALTALGAPQWHHQRTIGTYDGVTNETFKEKGIKYNPQWGYLNGEEFTWRRNFYHKPKVFLNWYFDITDKTKLATTAYVSFGRGGGTGPRGKLNGSYETSSKFKDENGQVRFDDIQTWNSGGTVSDFGDDRVTWGEYNEGVDNRKGYFEDSYVNTNSYGFIRRASMNSHNWVGVLSNLTHEVNDNWNLSTGIDLRSYKGIHYRRVNNLLGADAYYTNRDLNIQGEFISQEKPADGLVSMQNDRRLGYWNDGLVRWIGAFGQVEYTKDKLSAFAALSLSNQSSKRIDYMNYLDGDPEQESDWQSFWGGNLKLGANYNIDLHHNVFVNGGYYERQPNFDAVFINYVNQVNPDAINEKILGLEAGYGYRSAFFNANLNLYRTEWKDRNLNRGVTLESGDGTANLAGIRQVHTGIEVDGVAKIHKLQLEGMVSVGNWTYGSDVTANVYDDDQQLIGTKTLYLDGVKVGDAAQFTGRLGATYELFKRFRLYASYYHADNLYANYNLASDKTFDHPGGQALALPSFDLVDAGLRYNFKFGEKVEAQWVFNINNVFDTEYISEAETNIVDPERFDDNIVYYGFGRTWNTGLKVSF